MSTDRTGRNTDSATLTTTVRKAWAAVEEAGVPGQVQEVAFTEVLRSLLGTKTQRASSAEQYESQPSHAESAREDSNAPEEASSSIPSEEDIFQTVSAETGVDVEKLEQIFLVDDEVVKLVGQHTKYGSTTAEQARTVARIVTAVRKLGMGHSATSFDLIKEACEGKHCYDSKNFASKHMQGIDGFVVKGEGRGRRLEVRGSGVSGLIANESVEAV